MRSLALLGLGLACFSVVGCSNSNTNTAPQRSVLAAKFSNLPNLDGSGHYALFRQSAGGGVALIARFQMTDDGVVTDLNGNPIVVTANGANFVPGIELANARRIFLTIEPLFDDDFSPDGPVILSGGVFGDGGFIDLNQLVRSELGTGFDVALEQSGGFYIHITPSDDTTRPNNNIQGVHFVSAGLKEGLAALGVPPSNAPNLDLGSLPSTLQYEGWVIEDINGRLEATEGRDRSQARFRSIGTFSDRFGNGFDSDGIGAQAGNDVLPLAGLNGWVGSDFVTQGPLGQGEELGNGDFWVAISVEPVDDNDPDRPFAIVLYRNVPAGAAAGSGNIYSMSNSFAVGNTLFSPPVANLKLLP